MKPELGIENGQLTPCPTTPNCVSSQATDDKHYIEPIVTSGTTSMVKNRLLGVLEQFPRSKVVVAEEHYIRSEFTSKIFRFVDDVEFYFPETQSNQMTIHVRSASRIGHSDLGVNRKRVEKIRHRFNATDTAHQDQPRALVVFDRHGEGLDWVSIGDRIMGGQSDGAVVCTDQGYGCFYGTVRRDNGGGFASAKADLPEPLDVSGWTGIELLARGDGKTYKIGVRNSTDRSSVVYQHSFTPDSQDWTRIRLPFSDFVPTRRGRTVTNAEPLNTRHLASLSLFVSGAQVGEFELQMRNWVLF